MNDEQFANDLRPASIFGSLGTSDHFDDDEQFGEMAGGWDGIPNAPEAQPNYVSEMSDSAPRQAPQYTAPRGMGDATTGSRTAAGLTLLMVAAGGLLGWHYGKIKGATGGVLVAGAVRNLYRAQRDMRSASAEVTASAVRPGLIGLVGLGGGGYLLYKANGR